MTSMAPQPPPDDDLRSDPDVPEGVRYDPDLAVHEPMQVPERPPDPSRRRTALLLFPFGLLALSLGVYVLFGLIAEEGKTAADYLDDIRLHPGSGWQAALELSRLVSHEDAALRDPRLRTPPYVILGSSPSCCRCSRGRPDRTRGCAATWR
jgi:hypothetical protein